MPRKAFVADLQQATVTLPHKKLANLKAGDDDGTFAFTCKMSGDQASVTVNACISGTVHFLGPGEDIYSL